MKLPIIIIGAVVLAVIAAGAGFFGGMSYAQAQAASAANTFFQQRAGQNAQGGNGQFGSGQFGNGQTAANNPCGFPTGDRNFGQGNTQPGQTGQTGQNAQGTTGQRGQFGGGFGGFGGFNPAQFGNCVARGQIKSVNGDTVEISTADKVVVVKVNDATLISKTDKGALSDLQPGDRVTVFSKETGDSPTASTIQLTRPITTTQQ